MGASNEMCAAFDDDADKCDGRSQCVFRSGKDADCTFTPTTTTTTTTTSQPWLGAKSESKTQSKRAKGAKAQHQQEAMLFGDAGAESVVAQTMQTQVSLSSVVLFLLAALALQQVYKCFASRNAGYKQIRSINGAAAYHTMM